MLSRITNNADESPAPIFRNARGGVLTRDGAAYLIDKYLLQAGVDTTLIRDYLGHASVATTSRYVSTNVEMKREALEAFWRRARIPRNQGERWRPKPDITAFLASL